MVPHELDDEVGRGGSAVVSSRSREVEGDVRDREEQPRTTSGWRGTAAQPQRYAKPPPVITQKRHVTR
ncbi:hypothetical protein LK08_12020 [Streptomyces sp. MUSC 125]|nr:hypothetical protein LK08_12020 [Streptomyces sp. MUSC 125]